MKVSIIIPVYNGEQYISAALDSLRDQKYSDIEIIIVDDGSTDQTKTVVSTWSFNNSHCFLKYVYQENAGVSSARNTGIEYAEGEFLLFCDADDLFHTDFVSSFIANKKKYNSDTIACRFTHNYKEFESISEICSYETDIKKKFLYENSQLTFCGFLYEKSVIDKYSIRFSHDLRYGEDEEFTWKYLCHVKTSVFIDAPLYYYRLNPNSVTNSIKNYNRTQVIDSMIRVGAYYNLSNNEFETQIINYGIPRAVIAILHEFAITNNKCLFYKLKEDKNYKVNLFGVFKSPSIMIKATVLLYYISPTLFYYVFSKLKL